MSRTGAELLVDTLTEYGVTHVFGNPGTTELPIVDALSRDGPDYILALHEDIAVGMAAGYARTRAWHANDDPSINPVGIVNLHVTPGLTHGLGNLFNAGQIGTGAPIVVTAGAHALDHGHREPNLHGDLVSLADPLTKWSAEVPRLTVLGDYLRRAVRVALTPPCGPTFLALPFDVMTDRTDAEVASLGSIPTAGSGSSIDVSAAVETLVESEEIILVAGDGVGRSGRPAVSAAVRFAEIAGAGVVGEFRMSELDFPVTHPQWLGRLPDDRTTAEQYLSADTVVFAGVVSNVPTNPPDVPNPEWATTTCIQISDDGHELGKNYRADVSILGEPGMVLDRLAEEIGDQLDDAQRERRISRVIQRERTGRLPSDQPTGSTGTASKADLAQGLAGAAPNALVVAEAITSAKWLHAAYAFEPESFCKQRGGGLGYGMPATLGAALATAEHGSDRPVIGFIGDGAYLYYPQTIYTAARYDIDVTIVVADNRNYRVLKNNMLSLFGGTEEDYHFIGMDFDPPIDIPMNARSHGASGRLVEVTNEIEDSIAAAVAEDGPSVVDVLIHD